MEKARGKPDRRFGRGQSMFIIVAWIERVGRQRLKTDLHQIKFASAGQKQSVGIGPAVSHGMLDLTLSLVALIAGGISLQLFTNECAELSDDHRSALVLGPTAAGPLQESQDSTVS